MTGLPRASVVSRREMRKSVPAVSTNGAAEPGVALANRSIALPSRATSTRPVAPARLTGAPAVRAPGMPAQAAAQTKAWETAAPPVRVAAGAMFQTVTSPVGACTAMPPAAAASVPQSPCRASPDAA